MNTKINTAQQGDGLPAKAVSDFQAYFDEQQAALAQQGDGELPPLPTRVYLGGDEAFGDVVTGYTENCMRDYARAALAQRYTPPQSMVCGSWHSVSGDASKLVGEINSDGNDIKANIDQRDGELPLPDGVEGMLAYERSPCCITYTHDDLLAVRSQALAQRARTLRGNEAIAFQEVAKVLDEILPDWHVTYQGAEVGSAAVGAIRALAQRAGNGEAKPFVPAGYTNETEFLSQQLKDARTSIKAHQAVINELNERLTAPPAAVQASNSAPVDAMTVARNVRDAIFCTDNPCATDDDLRRAMGCLVAQPDSGRDAALEEAASYFEHPDMTLSDWAKARVAAAIRSLKSSAQPTENAAVQSLTDAALVETSALLEREQRDAQALSSLLHKERARFEFLHSTNRDADGWEWGVARVRVAADGRIEYLWGNSDHSDIDAQIAAASAKGGA